MSLNIRSTVRPDGGAALPRWRAALAVATGVTCVAIGLLHIALGTASVPGEGGLGATVDSRERFYGAVFAAYGAAWLWVVRSLERPRDGVRALALVLLAGGVARLVSIAVHGEPQWFQLVLLVVELVLPLAFLAPVRPRPDR